MDSDVELRLHNWSDFAYVCQNMRKIDKKELGFQQFTDDNYWVMPAYSTHAFIGTFKGDPFCAFGANETERAMHLWFFSTPTMAKHWHSAFTVATVFLDWLQENHFGKHVLVWTWQGHRPARAWNWKLGFRPTRHSTRHNGALFELWERRR